jgi:hypothetical protein
MNERQIFALSRPLENRFSYEPEYRRKVVFEELEFFTMLTVERIDDEWFWHASVAGLSPIGMPLPVSAFDSPEDQRRAARCCHDLLTGVGTGKPLKIPIVPGSAIHTLKRASSTELVHLVLANVEV